MRTKEIEALVNAYKYWSNKYAMSSHVNDLQQKTNLFKQLIEETNDQGISKDVLDKMLGR